MEATSSSHPFLSYSDTHPNGVADPSLSLNESVPVSPSRLTTTTSISSADQLKDVGRTSSFMSASQSVSHSMSQSKRISSTSLESDRAEKIAHLIRQHKDAFVDKNTGIAAIPPRSASAAGQTNPFSTALPIHEMNISAETGSAGSISQENDKEDTPVYKSTTQLIPKSVSQHPPPLHSTPGPFTMRDSSDLSKDIHTNMKVDADLMTSEFPKLSLLAPSIPNILDFGDGLVADAQEIGPISQNEKTDTQEQDRSSPDHGSPLSSGLSEVDIIAAEAKGKIIFDDASDIPPEKIAIVLGKGTDYNRHVLIGYMRGFNFSGLNLDEAFRQLCEKLLFRGETQMIDRILYQFSQRFWECNSDQREIYRSVDIVYGILFSIVLLNTDLHIVNIGPNAGKQMPRKVFIKNTMDLVDTMIAKDTKIQEEINLNADEARKWRRDLETILRTLYMSIRDNKIIQQTTLPDTKSNTMTNNLSSSPERMPETTQSGLTRTGSTLSMASTRSLGLTNIPSMEKLRASFFPSWRRPVVDKDSVSSVSDEGNGNPHTSLKLKTTASPLVFPPHDYSDKRKSAQPPTPKTFDRRSSAQLLSNNATVMDLCSGFLIRKHLLEKEGSKAKHRRWHKFWCVLSNHADRGLELTMTRVTSPKDANGFEATEIPVFSASAVSRAAISPFASPTGTRPPSALTMSRQRAETLPTPGRLTASKSGIPTPFTDETLADVPRLPLPGGSSKLMSQYTETFSLLHAISWRLENRYSESRSHVFGLRLPNGCTYLFHGPTGDACSQWVRVMNYYAAMKSKEPLRGGMSNVEHGWTFVAWERRALKQQQTSSMSHSHEESDRTRISIETTLSGTTSATAPTAKVIRGTSFDMTSSLGLNQDRPLSSGASIRSVPILSVSGSNGSGSPLSMPESLSGILGSNGKVKPKVRILDWVAPAGVSIVVSQLSLEAQLQSMRKQVQCVLDDIEEHESYKQRMEEIFADTLHHQKVLTNWQRRRTYLQQELDKYTMYAAVLSGDTGDEAFLSGAGAPSLSLSLQLLYSSGKVSASSGSMDSIPLDSHSQGGFSPTSLHNTTLNVINEDDAHGGSHAVKETQSPKNSLDV